MNALLLSLARMDRPQLLAVVRSRSAADHRPINAADQKARAILNERGDRSWYEAVRSAVNASSRAIRQNQGLDVHAATAVLAAAEEATLALLAKDALTEAEYALLCKPLGAEVAPWLLDGSEPPEASATAAVAAGGPVAGSFRPVPGKKPPTSTPAREEEPVAAEAPRSNAERAQAAAEMLALDLDEDEDDDPLGLLSPTGVQDSPEPVITDYPPEEREKILLDTANEVLHDIEHEADPAKKAEKIAVATELVEEAKTHALPKRGLGLLVGRSTRG